MSKPSRYDEQWAWMPDDYHACEVYEYRDAAGATVFGVSRADELDEHDHKVFRQWRPDPDSATGRRWSLKWTGADGKQHTVPKVPFELPRVLKAIDAGETIWIAEGEKDVMALERAGAVATCNAGGAGKWTKAHARYLDGASVVIIADKDAPGWSHARQVADTLRGVAASVKVVCAAEGKDASDHLDGGHGIAEFAPLDLGGVQPDWARGAGILRSTGHGAVAYDPASQGKTSMTSGASAEDMDTFTALGGELSGDEILQQVYTALTKFVVFPSAEHAVAVTLFTAATHAVSQLEVAPRLRVKSPVKRCGRSRLLAVLTPLCRSSLPAANISAAALVRSIGPAGRTLILDEMDSVFGKTAAGDEKSEALRGILNAGFQRGAPYIRYNALSGESEAFPTFALAILAGIGSLPDTVEDRSIIVPLGRKTDADQVARFRIRRDVPALRELGARLAAWVESVAEKVGDAEPAMPDGLSDRAEDLWEPLVAVADAAGGSWPDMARAVAVKLAAEAAAADPDASMTSRLLADLRTVFGTDAAMWTSMITARLAQIEGAPWGDWRHGKPLTGAQLAASAARQDRT